MKNIKSFYILTIIFALIFATSCNDDDVMIPVTPEVITTLNYTLTPDGGGDAITLSFQDPDGDGGNDPTIIGGTLQANTVYTGSLDLLNESESPAESITEEIQEEDEEHQFFFSTSGANLVVSYADKDADNLPVGLVTTITTGDASSGTLTVILRHQPDKNAAGVSDGDISNAGGETDIEVMFPVEIQ